MLIHDPDRLAGHLTRCQRLGWPVPRSLRAAVVRLLGRRGWTVRDHAAPAAVLTLAMLVASLPACGTSGATP